MRSVHSTIHTVVYILFLVLVVCRQDISSHTLLSSSIPKTQWHGEAAVRQTTKWSIRWNVSVSADVDRIHRLLFWIIMRKSQISGTLLPLLSMASWMVVWPVSRLVSLCQDGICVLFALVEHLFISHTMAALMGVFFHAWDPWSNKCKNKDNCASYHLCAFFSTCHCPWHFYAYRFWGHICPSYRNCFSSSGSGILCTTGAYFLITSLCLDECLRWISTRG